MSQKNREGFGWTELISLALATMIPAWLHFESKSWGGVTEAPTWFLYITMAGLLACGYVAFVMYLHSRAVKPRQSKPSLIGSNWDRDDYNSFWD